MEKMLGVKRAAPLATLGTLAVGLWLGGASCTNTKRDFGTPDDGGAPGNTATGGTGEAVGGGVSGGSDSGGRSEMGGG